MRLICLSDTHRLEYKIPIPNGDVLIHAGDMTGRGNYHEFIEMGLWMEKLKNRFKHRIIIAGNHDFGFEFNAKKIMEDHFDPDVTYLQDSGIEIDGIKFWGSPWTVPFYNWAFMKPEEELALEWEKIPNDTDILITHSPPHGILDQNAEKEHCGSVALYDRIKQLQTLKHHIFGHIHEQGSKNEQIDNVWFHNVCSLNGMYRYAHPPTVIDI